MLFSYWNLKYNDSLFCLQGWFPPGKKVDNFENRYTVDEELYPANNGGYYNRNVYSEKYFKAHPNIIKFYDLPNLDKTPKQSRYHQSQNIEKSSKNETQNLIGRTYAINSRKNSDSDSTYRAFGEDETDEENYVEEGGYDELQSSQQQRPRIQNQYERPNFDNDSCRSARLSSFRNIQGLMQSQAPSQPPPPPHLRSDSITR